MQYVWNKKSVVWIEGLILKFTTPGQIVVDPCTIKFSNENLFMLLRRHCYIRYNMYTLCFKESVLFLKVLFARQVFNDDSDIIFEPAVKTLTKTLPLGLHGISARREGLLWDSPRGLYPTHAFPSYITYFHPNRYRIKDPSLLEMCKTLPFMQWSETWGERFYIVDWALHCLWSVQELRFF